MRVTNFLRHFAGKFEVEILTTDGNNFITLKAGTLEELVKECDDSFNPLDGFKDELWEKEVHSFKVRNDKIAILINK